MKAIVLYWLSSGVVGLGQSLAFSATEKKDKARSEQQTDSPKA
jgi:membrane protein insertase Oxa1/YidC/SpoIIIJ